MRHRHRILLAALAAGAVGLAAWGMWRPRGESDQQLIEGAQRAFYQGRTADAERLAKEALARRPDWQEALLYAGRAAAQSGRPDEAFALLDRTYAQGGHLASQAAFVAAELRLKLGQPHRAEIELRKVLQLTPDHKRALARLANLLNVTGRRWEAGPYLLELVRQSEFDAESLILLGDLDRLVESPRELETMRQAAPDDPAPLVGLARLAIAAGDWPQAEALLRRAIDIEPTHIEAHAQLGWVLLRREDEPGLGDWHAALPGNAGVHPAVWLVRGLWARRNHQDQAACRCFWETLRRDPNNTTAHENLSELLDPDHPSRGYGMLVARTEKLSRLESALRALDAARGSGDPAAQVEGMIEVAGLCEELGRKWEAWAWNGLVLRVAPTDARALREFSRLGGLLTPATPQVLTVDNPSAVINLSTFPLPEWPPADAVRGAEEREASAAGNGAVGGEGASDPPSTPDAE